MWLKVVETTAIAGSASHSPNNHPTAFPCLLLLLSITLPLLLLQVASSQCLKSAQSTFDFGHTKTGRVTCIGLMFD
jgi:hypothetical protein